MATNTRNADPPGRARRSLGKQINYLARGIRWVVEHELAPLGVGSGTHFFLRVIHQNPGITQNELSRRTQIDKATAAKGLARLESLGYLSRVPDTGDRRIRRLYLTKAGERIIPSVYATLRHVTGICSVNLDTGELDRLFALLDRVEGALSAHIAAMKQERIRS